MLIVLQGLSVGKQASLPVLHHREHGQGPPRNTLIKSEAFVEAVLAHATLLGFATQFGMHPLVVRGLFDDAEPL